jgi:hypothetical protein
MFDTRAFPGLPAKPGVGYKPQHLAEILRDPGPVAWLEIHAENYMGAGGPPHAQLRRLRESFPISCHGVGLSIGGEKPLDRDHLARLKHLVTWLEPQSFSEHLAWSTHDTGYLNDLLPLPYDDNSLTRVCDHILQVQDALARPMLLENPTSYLSFETSTLAETDFLREVTARTGCGLLLDVNNVHISSVNLGFAPRDYIGAYPLELAREIHLGGYNAETDAEGRTLLIDSHGAPVSDPVWDLYAFVIRRGGARPTLIEWDNDVPEWAVLAGDAARADGILAGV